MNTTTLKRINNEIKQLQSVSKENSHMFDIQMVADNVFHWRATIYGPVDTLYANYEFILDIVLPADYPKNSPSIKFITPIQHLNINTAGDICLDILKEKWTPTLKITSVLVSIISLLGDSNPQSPLNYDLAELYRTDYDGYVKMINNACQVYAKKHKH